MRDAAVLAVGEACPQHSGALVLRLGSAVTWTLVRGTDSQIHTPPPPGLPNGKLRGEGWNPCSHKSSCDSDAQA